MKKIRVGIVGCGAIGTSLAKAVARDFSKGARLSALYDINLKKTKDLSRVLARNIAVSKLSQLISKSDLVI
ncbi:MAG: Gfo/Idh/MocA family oxidoreductase [Candidatus Omnitrophica bacterium]|nr:Gfo/Idh/MocA family oxidoreductase [Candidatus Omnitrophota bacterium]